MLQLGDSPSEFKIDNPYKHLRTPRCPHDDEGEHFVICIRNIVGSNPPQNEYLCRCGWQYNSTGYEDRVEFLVGAPDYLVWLIKPLFMAIGHSIKISTAGFSTFLESGIVRQFLLRKS